MENTYIEVIDALCDKLGVAATEASKLVPEIISRGIWSSALAIVLSIVMIVSASICLVKAAKSMGEYTSSPRYKGWLDNYGTLETLAIATSIIVLVIGVVWVCVSIYDLACWLSAPNVSALSWVLGQFK